jgi:geranylgeranyl reductase
MRDLPAVYAVGRGYKLDKNRHFVLASSVEYKKKNRYIARKNTEMDKNVAIIGGSAAGLFTASLLAKNGLNARVFEAADRFLPPQRTLIVTKQMRDILGPACERSVINEIHRFELFSDGRFATIPLRQPDLIVERSALIKELKDDAERFGAEILLGRKFLNLEPNGERLSFRVSKNGGSTEESADIIIGADGANSKVARNAGLPDQKTVSLMQAVVELPEDMPQDTTRVWFVPEDTPYFYWLIPHSSAHGVLGTISEVERDGLKMLERFIDKKGLAPLDLQSAQIPKYTKWISNHRKIGSGEVYLVGDAAGHVKVTTVGGIVTGFKGVLGVIEAILNNGYTSTLQSLKRELERHKIIRNVLHHFAQEYYIKLLDLLNPSLKDSLGLFTRDESLKIIRKVFLHRPSLILLALRALLIGGLSANRHK